METVILNVESRETATKGETGRIRRSGKVPAVFYGPGKIGQKVCVDAREFRMKLDGLEGSHLIQLLSPAVDLNEKTVLLKEVQRHPVSSAPMHIDFYEVDVTKPITVTVPLHFVGKAQGVTAGGLLQSLRREVTVECLPREIPDFIQFDVTSLALHDTVHIADLVLPPGVKAVYDTNDAVVTIASPVAEAKPTAAEGEAAAATAAAAAAAAAPAAGAPAKAGGAAKAGGGKAEKK
ncbi:MAG: 50S ribosomal protein L25 [Deltaproteobacteria bacterium]|nr:50S ribosomal protein L25 [Deltaproteobacteria bacterium]